MPTQQQCFAFVDYKVTNDWAPCVTSGTEVFCFRCNEMVAYETIDSEVGVCYTCRDQYYVDCCMCDTAVYYENTVTLKGKEYCQECCKSISFKCNDCGNIVHNDHYHHNSICDDCSENYFYCEGCDGYRHNDNYGNNGYCDNCSCSSDNDEFEDHYVSMAPFKVVDKNKPMFGVEVEFECESGNRYESVQEAIELMGSFASIKHDGSLENGFEIASRPTTIAINKEKWGAFFDNLPSGTYTEDTCGMHVHISRKGMSALTVGKMIVFFNTKGNRAFIQKMAGRNNIYSGSYDHYKKVTDGGKEGTTRYEAINTTNSNTYEVRIFAGCIDNQVFNARIEFIEAIMIYCKLHGVNELTHESFTKWVKDRGKAWPALIKYLAK